MTTTHMHGKPTRRLGGNRRRLYLFRKCQPPIWLISSQYERFFFEISKTRKTIIALFDFRSVIYALKYLCDEKISQVGDWHFWNFPCHHLQTLGSNVWFITCNLQIQCHCDAYLVIGNLYFRLCHIYASVIFLMRNFISAYSFAFVCFIVII